MIMMKGNRYLVLVSLLSTGVYLLIFFQETSYNFYEMDHTVKKMIPDSYYEKVYGLTKRTYTDLETLQRDHGSTDASRSLTLSTGSDNFFVDGWRNIINSSVEEFIYSAHRDGDIIRIIGAKRTRSKFASAAKFCKVWYSLPNKTIGMSTVRVNSSILPENHGKMFSAAYFTCPVPRQLETTAVALVVTNDTKPSRQDILPVVKPVLTRGGKRNFSICGPILHSNYSRINELIEWIELNKILGAQFFTFYNYSVASNIEPVLSYYLNRGEAEVLQWNIPVLLQSPGKIHYFSQLAALNDCLYRNRHRTRHLAFFDLDEFIIPRRKQDLTWIDLLKRLPSASSYGFRSVLFRKQWQLTSTNDQLAEKYKLTSLLRLQRDLLIFRMGARSKLIVDPNKVETIGIHFVWKHREGKTRTVEEHNGLLHHYRFEIWNNTKYSDDHTTDEGMMKYKNILITNVKKAWKSIGNSV